MPQSSKKSFPVKSSSVGTSSSGTMSWRKNQTRELIKMIREYEDDEWVTLGFDQKKVKKTHLKNSLKNFLHELNSQTPRVTNRWCTCYRGNNNYKYAKLKTSKPKTSKSKTSKPKTSKPKTSKSTVRRSSKIKNKKPIASITRVGSRKKNF